MSNYQQNIQYYRGVAAKRISEKIVSWQNIPAPVSDKAVDDLARQILGLPQRPNNSDPYVGWILPPSNPIPYLYQLNNRNDPTGSCLLTCAAMVAQYFGKSVTPDEFYALFVKRGWSRFIHANIARLLSEYGITDDFSTEHSWGDVKKNLDKGYPVIFSGPKSFTKSGHVILLISYDDQGFTCHDPYGQYTPNGYINKPEVGKFIRYDYQTVYAQSAGGSKSTWAHLTSPLTPPALRRVVGDENCSPEFKQKVKGIAARINCDPSDIMAVMSFESGGTFSPAVKNAAGSGATGLIQFMPATAVELGTSTTALARMSPVAQLDFVEKYFNNRFKNFPGKKSLADLYMAVLWPAAVGKGESYRLFNSPSITYRQNAGLDFNKDGSVTVGEAVAKVRARFI